MEPLVPTSGRGELAELSVEIIRKSGELAATLTVWANVAEEGRMELLRKPRGFSAKCSNGLETRNGSRS